MHDNAYPRVLRPEILDLACGEAGMHRTMPLPEDEPGVVRNLWLEAAPDLVRIPHHHLVKRDADGVSGVAPEMLIGQKQDPIAPLPGPSQRRGRVRRRADHAAPFAAKGLNGHCRVDVGHGNDRSDAHLLELCPAHLELLWIRHVGHRAAGGQVGQNHLLVRRGMNIGAFGHEVNAAEDDEVGVGVTTHLLGQLVRVPSVVGELDDLVALVVMTQYDEAPTQSGLSSPWRKSLLLTS